MAAGRPQGALAAERPPAPAADRAPAAASGSQVQNGELAAAAGRPASAATTQSASFAGLVAGRVEQLLHHLMPSFASEVEAFMFGSVPLRTVLPDGDVDISVFCPAGPPASAPGGASIRDTWAMELLRALEREQAAPNPLFTITDVHCIHAEVRLVKCIVADLVVDISFDTLGGLCTVAFLEAVDRRVGLNHLFKRSIVLIKAWCYYESRLLGAHHGLISSYALETMVLYIINLHHAELASPLDVLRKFLQVFASFDWKEYCLSVHGPISISSFPQPRVDYASLPPSGLLLDEEFMVEALQAYAVRPLGMSGLAPEAVVASSLPLKHLNVIDPLLPSNNLGRSVSRASYARIRQAFMLGYRTLDEAMSKDCAKASLDAVDMFFKNTWRSPMRTSADNQLFLRRLTVAAGSGFVGGPLGGPHAGLTRSSSIESLAAGLAQALVAQQQQQAMVQMLSESLLVQPLPAAHGGQVQQLPVPTPGHAGAVQAQVQVQQQQQLIQPLGHQQQHEQYQAAGGIAAAAPGAVHASHQVIPHAVPGPPLAGQVTAVPAVVGPAAAVPPAVPVAALPVIPVAMPAVPAAMPAAVATAPLAAAGEPSATAGAAMPVLPTPATAAVPSPEPPTALGGPAGNCVLPAAVNGSSPVERVPLRPSRTVPVAMPATAAQAIPPGSVSPQPGFAHPYHLPQLGPPPSGVGMFGLMPAAPPAAASSQGGLGLSLHALLASGQLADALAGDLATLARNLRVARCQQQLQAQAAHLHQVQAQVAAAAAQQQWKGSSAGRRGPPLGRQGSLRRVVSSGPQLASAERHVHGTPSAQQREYRGHGDSPSVELDVNSPPWVPSSPVVSPLAAAIAASAASAGPMSFHVLGPPVGLRRTSLDHASADGTPSSPAASLNTPASSPQVLR